MYVVFKVTRRRAFLDRRDVYWTGETVTSGDPAETVSLSKAAKFLYPRAAYRAAGDQGRLSYWQVGVRP